MVPPNSDYYFCKGGVVVYFSPPNRLEPPASAVYPAATPVSADDGPNVLLFG